MCLVLAAFRQHPRYDLILAANRDERRDRPALPMAWWPDAEVCAGRDQRAGGTWLALNRAGDVAVVTNWRDPAAPLGRRSRGELPLRGLAAEAPLEDLAEYGGFHLARFDQNQI